MTDDDGVRGGWRLHLLCIVCSDEATYTGFVMTQAADRATKDGWIIDYENLHASAHDRYAVCPNHAD